MTVFLQGLAGHFGLNAAREKLRVAHALADLPKISASFAQGEISYSRVRAMTRVATAENEAFLLMIARHGTASHVERALRQYRRAKQSASTRARRVNTSRCWNGRARSRSVPVSFSAVAHSHDQDYPWVFCWQNSLLEKFTDPACETLARPTVRIQSSKSPQTSSALRVDDFPARRFSSLFSAR